MNAQKLTAPQCADKPKPVPMLAESDNRHAPSIDPQAFAEFSCGSL